MTVRCAVIGVGYLGERLARALETHCEVQRVERDGVPKDATHILSTVAPDEHGEPIVRAHVEALRGAQWLGYVSTTGVYKDSGGAWVDEDGALEANNERRARRLDAEAAWRALARPLALFRVAGIYGPGRSALDQLREGRACRIHKPGKVFNRVHVDDIVTTLEAALRTGATGVFNVVDDEPLPQPAAVEHAAQLLSVAPPTLEDFESAEMSPMMRSFFDGNLRVRSRRRDELGIQLQYPNVRSGLDAIFRGGS